MKSQIVYKICAKVGRSRMSMCQEVIPEEFRLRYPLGKKVKSKVDGSAIFVFDNLSIALVFIRSRPVHCNYVLLECTTTSDIVPIKYASHFRGTISSTLKSFRDFWRNKMGQSGYYIFSTPPGTRGVSSLTPIKEIKL